MASGLGNNGVERLDELVSVDGLSPLEAAARHPHAWWARTPPSTPAGRASSAAEEGPVTIE